MTPLLRHFALGLLVAVGAGAPIAAQTATLRGFVRDASDGQALPGVNVIATSSAGVRVGAASDANGIYLLAQLPVGRYVLQTTYVGYTTRRDTVNVVPGLQQLDLALTPDELQLGEVQVEAERASGATLLTAGLQTIRPSDLARIPAPDVSGDLAAYLTTLPGVVTTGDQGGQLFIRGGEPTQNLVFLDGMALLQPFHVLGFYSVFPADILKSADVYAGAYGARYGGQLSSVIDVTTREGNKRQFAASVAGAPFVSSLLLEGPVVRDRVSFLTSARYALLEETAPLLTGDEQPYTFTDVFSKLHAQPSPASQVSASFLYSSDRARLGTSTDPTATLADAIRWSTVAGGVRYLFLPATVPVLAEAMASVSRTETSFGPADRPTRFSNVQRQGGGFHLRYFLRYLTVDAGAEVATTFMESALGGLFQNIENTNESLTEASAYVEPTLKAGGVEVRTGLRVVASPNQNESFLEPRFRLTWNVGVHQLSAAGGRYNQAIVGLNDRRDATNLFTAWTSPPTGDTPRALHALAGYRVSPTRWADLSVEGYYKRLYNLSISEWTSAPRLTTNVQDAEGEAYGLDLRTELRAGPSYLSVSYGWSVVRYLAEEPFYTLWFGTDQLLFNPPHDRRHQLSTLLSTDLAGFTLSARWQFGSGLPFSRPIGFDRFVLLETPIDPFTESGEPRVIYERPYNARLPTYHRLDVTIERAFDLGKRAKATVQAGVINAYDRRNLFSYDLFTLQRTDQLPFFPTFGFKLAY